MFRTPLYLITVRRDLNLHQFCDRQGSSKKGGWRIVDCQVVPEGAAMPAPVKADPARREMSLLLPRNPGPCGSVVNPRRMLAEFLSFYPQTPPIEVPLNG